MDGAAADIVSTHGEKPKQALSAAFKVMCPGQGGIVNGASTDAITENEVVQVLGGLISEIEGLNMSCAETKAGFQIYLLLDLNQVTKSHDDIRKHIF